MKRFIIENQLETQNAEFIEKVKVIENEKFELEIKLKDANAKKELVKKNERKIGK